MTYGPTGQRTLNTFVLILRKLAAIGSPVVENTVQDTVVLPRKAKLLSAKFVASAVTSAVSYPQASIALGTYYDCPPGVFGRLMDHKVDIKAANTAYTDGGLIEAANHLEAGSKITLRLVTQAGDDIEGVVCTMEFQALEDFTTPAQDELQAELDMSTVNAQLDNVIQATRFGSYYNAIRIKVIGDSAAAAGVTIDVSDMDFVIHFESGVSTQGDVNTAINALTGSNKLIQVKTAGTTDTVLVNGRSFIDMDTVFTDADSTIQAGFNTGVDGDLYGVMAIPDGTGAGSLEVLDLASGGKMLVYHFEDGVSTVTNFEDALALLSPADFELKTAGTGANTFDNPDDACTDMLASGTATHAENDYTNLAGGLDLVG